MKKLVTDELEILAYDKVKRMILSNKFEPGQKIVQEKLAAELGISRTPLRSALKMLEAEYLIQSIPRRGVVVRTFSDHEIIEIFDCRVALEGTAFRLLASSATSKQVLHLKQLFAPFMNVPNVDEQAYQAADSQFHDCIISWCGNSFLTKIFNKSNLLICIDRIGLIRPPSETLPEHLEMIDAVERNKPKEAEHLAKNHLLKSKHIIINRIHK